MGLYYKEGFNVCVWSEHAGFYLTAEFHRQVLGISPKNPAKCYNPFPSEIAVVKLDPQTFMNVTLPFQQLRSSKKNPLVFHGFEIIYPPLVLPFALSNALGVTFKRETSILNRCGKGFLDV